MIDCPQDLPVDAGCVHPTVSASCSAGWCRIPAGCFVMGSAACEYMRGKYSEPEVQVTLTHDFEMRQFETTQGDWTHFGFPIPFARDAGIIDAQTCGAADCPVANVTFTEAAHFANKLSEERGMPPCYELSQCTGAVGQGLTGMVCSIRQTTPSVYDCKGYRLPTEAEWEYAARAGTRTAFYSGGIAPINSCDENPYLDPIAWFCHNSGGVAHPVGLKLPNAWGLHDMLGNMGEWVTGEFNGLGYGTGPFTDMGSILPSSPGTGIFRGGSYVTIAPGARCAYRGDITATIRAFGFRLVRTLSFPDAGLSDAAAE